MVNEEQAPAAVTDRSIHSPSNFHPEQYEVLDYLDNQPPRWEQFAPYFGAPASSLQYAREQFEGARSYWAKEMDSYFPHRAQQQPSIHHCTHCGNGMVRYIVAVRHLPTGQNVVFGSDCVERLGFANRDAFKAAQLRAKAEAGNKRMAAYAARLRFLEANPEFKAALEGFDPEAPAHKRNDFARDIVAKFNQYGNLSDAQVQAFMRSLARDLEYGAKRAAEAQEVKGPVPTGRQEFDCEVVSVQQRESQWGTVWKILVKLVNNSKVWMTLPSSVDAKRGDRFRFRATIEASKDDVSFGFGKRPTLVADLAAAVVGPRNNCGEGA